MHDTHTAQWMKFSIKNFSSKCDQIKSAVVNLVTLLKKSLMEKFIFLCSGRYGCRVVHIRVSYTDFWYKSCQYQQTIKAWKNHPIEERVPQYLPILSYARRQKLCQSATIISLQTFILCNIFIIIDDALLSGIIDDLILNLSIDLFKAWSYLFQVFLLLNLSK